MKTRLVRTLWLIKRGPRPEHHRAPFHPVVICDLKQIYEWDRGSSSDLASCWGKSNDKSGGWLWLRWKGLDIDYGHVVHGFSLPDGRKAAFVHNHCEEPWSLLSGAVWWSNSRIPQWLSDSGVIYPPDGFSQLSILDTIAAEYDGDGMSGGGGWNSWPEWRHRPAFWPSLEDSYAANLSLSTPELVAEAAARW